MKVKMLVHGSGPDGAVKPGSEIEVSDEHGAELVAGGYAEEVPEPAVEETPDAETDETADDETPETAADEPAAEDVPETEAEEPAVEETPEPETKKKAPRKRRRTAKSGT